MNRTESAYADYLRRLEMTGEVSWYAYEHVKLQLAKATFLTPDFIVMRRDGEIEFHEVKGRKGELYYCQEDAKVKAKVAAAMYPFRFLIVWPLRGSGWGSEELSAEPIAV